VSKRIDFIEIPLGAMLSIHLLNGDLKLASNVLSKGFSLLLFL
jgi:hypothetical protein